MKKTVYLDMDGVLVDLEKGLHIMFNVDNIISDRDMLFNRHLPLYAVNGGWGKAPKMPCADSLVEFLIDLKSNDKINLAILTSVGKFYSPASKIVNQKKIWVEDNFKGLIGIPFCTTYSGSDKSMFAHGNAILIDDYLNNIEKFIDKGGIGIHYQESKFDFIMNTLVEKIG